MSSGRVVLDFGSSSNNNNNNANNILTTNQLSIPLMEGSPLCVYHVNCSMARNPVTQQQRFHGGQVLHIGRDFHSDDRITLSHPRNDVSFHLDIKSFSFSSTNEGSNNNNNTSSFLSSTSNNHNNNNSNSNVPSFLGATLVNDGDEDFGSVLNDENSNGTDFLAATLVVDQNDLNTNNFNDNNNDSQVMFLEATQVVLDESTNNNNKHNHLQQDHALFNAETESFSSDDDENDDRKNSNNKNQENDNGNSPDFDLLFGSSKKKPKNEDNITTQRIEPVHQDKSCTHSTTTSNQNTMTSPPQLNRKLDVPPYAVQERISGKIRGRNSDGNGKNQHSRDDYNDDDDDGGETEIDEDDEYNQQSLNLPMKRNNNTGSESKKFETGSLPSPPPLPQPNKGSETQVIAGATLGYDNCNSAYFSNNSNNNTNSSFIGAILVSDADQDDNMKQNSFHSTSFYSSVNYSAATNKNNNNNISSTTTTGNTLLPQVCTPAENVGIGAELLFPQDPYGLSTSPLNNQKQLSPTNISMLLPGNQLAPNNNKNNNVKQASLNATPEDSPQDKAASDKKKKNLKQAEKNGTDDVSDAETELFEAEENNNNNNDKKNDDGEDDNKIPTSGIRWQVFLGDDEDDDNSWKSYPKKIQDILEQAFAKYKAAKKKTKDVNQVAIDDVYLVDVRVKMQKRIDDNSRQRQVRRLEE